VHATGYTAAVPQFEALLAKLHQLARQAHPDIALSQPDFVAELTRRLGGTLTESILAACKTDDVYVVAAAARGNAKAIAHVETELQRQLDFAAPRTNARPDQVADARGVLRELLFTDTPDRTAAASSYAGRGDLAGFLRVIVTRELIKIVQKARREQPHESDELLALLSTGGDPELSILKEHYREGVTACVQAALAKLDDRSRTLLRYQLVDGLPVARVGALYGVHGATAARWIADARDKLGELIRGEVQTRLEVARDEVDSIMRLVQSRVELSLARLMASDD
jgi:RNA polymerase sigma-70 factor (ECF subfamily)